MSYARAARALKRAARPTIQRLEDRTLMAFGLTTSTNSYTVDTGANLVFAINRTTALGGSRGDLQSMKYNGTELEASFSATSRYSHYESGLGSGTVVTATTDPAGNWIKITCDDTAGTGVIQYYIARKGFNNIYMATYSAGPDSPSPGEMRFITYTNHTVLTNAPAASNLTGNTGAIESSDVVGFADGTSASKYYGEYRSIDAPTYGLTGGGFGVFMNIGNRETSSGGPFFKDIDFQTTSAASTELYTYTFSGHSQTENFRPGLKGPYALQFTTGATPAAPDYSFIDGLGLTGYVTSASRGNLSGLASGVPVGRQVTVALSNATAQYWGTPDASGNYAINGILPGTYVETLYQDELAVATVNVTISAGATTRQNITDTYYLPAAIWRIGTWDGTPLGFLNSDKITTMHPSDSRMSPWADATGLTNFIVGTSTDADFPMAEWKVQTSAGPVIDTTNRITFDLTAEQAATALTMRIGITRMDHGRPSISVNGVGQSVPGLTTQPNSRGVTLGNWRGNNTLYTWNISTSALHAGTNTIDISCASGSGSAGNYLSPWHIYDALDLVPTSSITNAPVVASITLSPLNPSVTHNTGQTFTAVARDQFNAIMAANFTWSATSGTVNGAGEYVAPNEGPSDTVFAKVVNSSGATITGQTTVNVVDTSPLAVLTSNFTYDTNHTLTFTFNKQNILRGSGGTDLLLQNLTTGQTVASTAMTYSPGTAKWTSPTPLADGNYRATLAVGSVKDSSGNTFTQDYTFDFFVFAGDANHDRTVDVNDLYIMATNWFGTGKTFSQGDFNYDGVVDGKDLGILSVRWQQRLDPPPPPAQPLPALVASSSIRATRAPARTAISLVT